MSDQRITLTLFNARQGNAELRKAWEWAKPLLIAGKRLTLKIEKVTRSVAQNSLLHSRINDIAKSMEWAGKKHDIDTWKRLLTAAWLRARGEPVEFLPALDGTGVDVVFRRTSDLTVAECVELSEFIMAWGDQQSIKWSRTSLGHEWPDEVTA